MAIVLYLPMALQGALMALDEGYCHRRRGLPRWERLGHPIDTLVTASCYAWIAFVSPDRPHALAVYVGLSVVSCLVITKDEPVHSKLCGPFESWLHSVLFVLHPTVLLSLALMWLAGGPQWSFQVLLAATLGFAAYQVLYWSRR